MDSSLLTTLDGRRRFVDTFDALLSRWQTVAGTLTVSGGLKASALGDWGNNLVTNGEFTTDTTGWSGAAGIPIVRVDSLVDPGTASGGADKWALKATAAAAGSYAYIVVTPIQGSCCELSGRVYVPAANTGINAARIGLLGTSSGGAYTQVTAEGAWTALTALLTTWTGASLWVITGFTGATSGDVAYFDAVQVYRQNAAAIMPFAPAFRARLWHVSPAAPSVVPAGWMFRYTDALNYWELRLLPNTDGNDLQLVQVTAGEETVRAEADVDWTAEGTDEIELTVRGSSITTRYRKAGGVWATGPSYASATQGAQARAMGPMLYGTTAARWARAEVDW
jgi:hypothetical protein